jgi:hypothetical protein
MAGYELMVPSGSRFRNRSPIPRYRFWTALGIAFLAVAALLAVAAVADWDGSGPLRLGLAVLFALQGGFALARLRHMSE